MPFTLSHPAAVIPFARGRLVPSALVIGSIAPDIPYFFFMMELRAQTHRPLGMISVDLTMALMVYTAFHMLWKKPLVALSPGALRDRLPTPRPLLSPWLLPSLFLGIVTHVVWDGFTHHDHGFATHLPWLVTISFGGLELYRWLQYVSGATGLLIMAWWAARWFRNTPAEAFPGPGPGPGAATATATATATASATASATAASVRARLVAGTLFIAGALAGGGYGAVLDPEGDPAGDPGLHARLVGGAVGVVAGLVVAVTIYSLAWPLTSSRRTGAALDPESPGNVEDLEDLENPENEEVVEVLAIVEGAEVLEGKVVVERNATPAD